MYTCKFSCLLEFRLRRTWQLCEDFVLHLYYKLFLIFFPDIISFQHVFHLGVGRSQIEWKLKVKIQILIFPWAKIGQNDHSNPYIENTTVLSVTKECVNEGRGA